jgi:hypothetical protein
VPTLYARAIGRAAQIIGDAGLAARLGVTEIQLRFWMQGVAEPPGDVFLKVAYILGEHSLEELRQPRSVAHAIDPDLDARK